MQLLARLAVCQLHLHAPVHQPVTRVPRREKGRGGGRAWCVNHESVSCPPGWMMSTRAWGMSSLNKRAREGRREGGREGGKDPPLMLLDDVRQSPLDQQVRDVVDGGLGAGFVPRDPPALGEALVGVQVVGPDGDECLSGRKEGEREGGRQGGRREGMRSMSTGQLFPSLLVGSRESHHPFFLCLCLYMHPGLASKLNCVPCCPPKIPPDFGLPEGRGSRRHGAVRACSFARWFAVTPPKTYSGYGEGGYV